MPKRPRQRPLPLWLRWLVLWSLRLIKIAKVMGSMGTSAFAESWRSSGARQLGCVIPGP